MYKNKLTIHTHIVGIMLKNEFPSAEIKIGQFHKGKNVIIMKCLYVMITQKPHDIFIETSFHVKPLPFHLIHNHKIFREV
jgi:hypothetical protein